RGSLWCGLGCGWGCGDFATRRVISEELAPALRHRGRIVAIEAVHLLDQARVGAQIIEAAGAFCHHTFIVYPPGNLRKVLLWFTAEPAPPPGRPDQVTDGR